ncbi:hypothetical protein SDC9_191553 [bioreactor metagenome]|uniref:Uncharacterized protein n=1 Tax=bioreactor metagenome TaxID=1076179 RepID=A0A645HZT1_9ZZZZ
MTDNNTAGQAPNAGHEGFCESTLLPEKTLLTIINIDMHREQVFISIKLLTGLDVSLRLTVLIIDINNLGHYLLVR